MRWFILGGIGLLALTIGSILLIYFEAATYFWWDKSIEEVGAVVNSNYYNITDCTFELKPDPQLPDCTKFPSSMPITAGRCQKKTQTDPPGYLACTYNFLNKTDVTVKLQFDNTYKNVLPSKIPTRNYKYTCTGTYEDIYQCRVSSRKEAAKNIDTIYYYKTGGHDLTEQWHDYEIHWYYGTGFKAVSAGDIFLYIVFSVGALACCIGSFVMFYADIAERRNCEANSVSMVHRTNVADYHALNRSIIDGYRSNNDNKV
jgi:hypothetical protein